MFCIEYVFFPQLALKSISNGCRQTSHKTGQINKKKGHTKEYSNRNVEANTKLFIATSGKDKNGIYYVYISCKL